MSENNILRLIEKFEESLEGTEKLTNIMIGLEGALKSLDISINEVYELTKVEDLTNKSSDLIEVLNNIRNTQLKINEEYSELINLKLYKENLKNEIVEVKQSIHNLQNDFEAKLDDSVLKIKEEMQLNSIKSEHKQDEMKEEILAAIKEIIDINKN